MKAPRWPCCRASKTKLNASAPPQQRLSDGWLLRFSPGKARRTRCVNAIAAGRLPVADKLTAYAVTAHRNRGLTRVLREHLLAGKRPVRASRLPPCDCDNGPARSLYRRLGFVDAYSYHYRTRDASAS
jgi:hypothetical protein